MGLAQPGEHVTLGLEVVSLNPTLAVEFILKKKDEIVLQSDSLTPKDSTVIKQNTDMPSQHENLER